MMWFDIKKHLKVYFSFVRALLEQVTGAILRLLFPFILMFMSDWLAGLAAVNWRYDLIRTKITT